MVVHWMRRAYPIEVKSLERQEREAAGVRTDVAFCQLSLMPRVIEFPHFSVGHKTGILCIWLDRGAQTNAICCGVIPCPHFDTKVAAEWHEGMKGLPVSQKPRRNTGQEDQAA